MKEKLMKTKKSKLMIWARKNSVKILSRYSKEEVVNAILDAKSNGTLKPRGF